MAAGMGNRFGSQKQFLQLATKPVVAWSVAAARTVADGVVLVVPDAPNMEFVALLPVDEWGADQVVTGGATRSLSVRAGLAAVPMDASVIIVHDAARPLASASLFTSVVQALAEDGVQGAIPVLPVTDTLKRVTANSVLSTVEREGIVFVQTPQAFDAATLRTAYSQSKGIDATDDARLLEGLGATVRTVPGEPRNFKLTYPEDLVLACALIQNDGLGR